MKTSNILKSVALIVTLFANTVAYSQSKSVEAFYQSRESQDDDVRMSITGNFLSFLSNFADEGEAEGREIKRAVEKIKELKILSISKSNIERGMILGLQKAIGKEGYEDYLIVREGSKVTKFMALEKGSKIISFILVSEGDENYTVLEFSGEIDPKTLSKISENAEIEGMEDLKKLKKK